MLVILKKSSLGKRHQMKFSSSVRTPNSFAFPSQPFTNWPSWARSPLRKSVDQWHFHRETLVAYQLQTLRRLKNCCPGKPRYPSRYSLSGQIIIIAPCLVGFAYCLGSWIKWDAELATSHLRNIVHLVTMLTLFADLGKV